MSSYLTLERYHFALLSSALSHAEGRDVQCGMQKNALDSYQTTNHFSPHLTRLELGLLSARLEAIPYCLLLRTLDPALF